MSKEPKVTIKKIGDYRPNPTNVNEGTERGDQATLNSFHEYGAARSIVTHNDDTTAAGAHALQAAADAGITEVVEVETDGTQLVVVKRIDWENANDPQAAEYAVADNRSSELGLAWSPEILAVMAQRDDIDLRRAGMTDGELAVILSALPDDVEFTEYDESVADEVEFHQCPECGHEFPK